MSSPAYFTCPDCRRVSFNPNDVREQYCGFCHTLPADRRPVQPIPPPGDYTVWGEPDPANVGGGFWLLVAAVLLVALVLAFVGVK